MSSQWRLRRALHEIASKDAFVTILIIGAGYAIETCNPLRLCGASAANHEVGARNAIESFLRKQALEVLRGPLVTILARYMRLKNDIFSTNFKEIFRARLVTLLAVWHQIYTLYKAHAFLQVKINQIKSNIVEKTFNRISRTNIVTSGTRYISKRWLTSKNFNRISRANIVTSGTRNISKAWSTSKIFNRISRATIVTSGTRNISKAWLTSKNFQSHFSRQYRNQRHSQHLQTLVDLKKIQSHFSRQYRD